MGLFWLFKKPRGLVPPREDLRLIMYTRAGCHLCESAWKELTEAQSFYRFRLEQKDVDDAAELVAAYGNCVPVVTVNGKVRFRGGVNKVLLQRIMSAPKPRDEQRESRGSCGRSKPASPPSASNPPRYRADTPPPAPGAPG